MGINFPNIPTVGQLWPVPATPGRTALFQILVLRDARAMSGRLRT